MVPAGGVEHGAGEVVEPRDVRATGARQGPGAVDDDLGDQHLAVRGRDRPGSRALVPAHLCDGDAEAGDAAETVTLRHVAEVGLDLRLTRVGPRPTRVQIERERVEMARDVARTPRIGVVPPGPPDLVGRLENRHLLESGPTQHDGCRDTGETRADHHGRVSAVRTVSGSGTTRRPGSPANPGTRPGPARGSRSATAHETTWEVRRWDDRNSGSCRRAASSSGSRTCRSPHRTARGPRSGRGEAVRCDGWRGWRRHLAGDHSRSHWLPRGGICTVRRPVCRGHAG